MSDSSVFTNSCIKVPLDPLSKMPKTAYERIVKTLPEQCSIDSTTISSVTSADISGEKVKDFYRSIPDYKEINHLSSSEFYSTLNSLREKKKIILGLIDKDECPSYNCKKYNKQESTFSKKIDTKHVLNSNQILNTEPVKESKKELTSKKIDLDDLSFQTEQTKRKNVHNYKHPGSCLKLRQCKNSDIKPKQLSKEKTNRNHSACSISWHDDKVIQDKNEIEEKFNKFFNVNDRDTFNGKEFKTQSMPSSPLRSKGFGLITNKNINFTIPKPFKMTKRDDEERIVNDLRSIQRSFSEDMLNQKRERKQFRAKPVPIESRIPLYDKILEDQAMRRAITKINSEAELRAQMKPFSFTKREENEISGICQRAIHVLPKTKKKKRFKARSVPKNLFSNYFYDKMKEDEFFRSMNRRIRAEEMLRNASYPRNMSSHDRSRLSTPAAHSDLPIDPSPAVPSTSSSDRFRCSSPTKGCKTSKPDFITTSPQPFRFKTASRANKKLLDIAEKVYQSKSKESISDCIAKPQAYSALELKANTTGRSNLAAVLRAESVRRKFEMEAALSQAEQRRRFELYQRSRQLRSKPAWHLVKNNHEQDIAMRLQTRRDEERMRREEFLHEMELMYGRVQQQPLLFERYYAPRSYSIEDSVRFSPRKFSEKKRSRKNRFIQIGTPSEDFESDIQNCTEKIEKGDKFAGNSNELIDSVDRSYVRS
ncbi:protein FAM161A [Battus philenor]|uniref:protein FAM161A n=1 Tax=Battus philenor TaxID=42288 RepID=UPI0035CF0CF2